MAHSEPRGCPFDYCGVKTQVQIRLRTGDICSDCHKLMVDKKLDFAIAEQVFGILDLIRSQILFRNRYGITAGTPALNVFTANRELIFFNESGKVKVHLDKREMAVYLLFLNHPDGIRFKSMPDHYREFRKLYKNYVQDANLPPFENTVDRIIDAVSNNTLSEIIAGIRKKLNYYLDEDIAGQYCGCRITDDCIAYPLTAAW